MGIILQEETGQGMVEYSLILALVALAAIGALKLVGQNTIMPMYEKIKTEIPE